MHPYITFDLITAQFTCLPLTTYPGVLHHSMFYNDGLVIDERDLPVRIEDNVLVDTLFFSTFFGGSSIPEYAAPADCWVYYRNFVISD